MNQEPVAKPEGLIRMYNTARSGTLNRNQNGPAKAGAEPISSGKSLGGPRTNASKVGAGSAVTPRPRVENSPQHPRQRGGQASIVLFGLPSATGRTRRLETLAPAKAAAQGQASPPRLNPVERRALLVLILRSLAPAKHRPAAPERDTLFADSPAPSASMRAAAYASDMREAFPCHHDDEEADRLHRTSGAGYVENQLAHD